MKTIRTTRAIAALLALGTLSVGNINVWAVPITIDDATNGDTSYWGAKGDKDVIGDVSVFGIDKAVVDYNHATGSLQVDIVTPYVSYVGNSGTAFGDLFLNASWNPYKNGGNTIKDQHFGFDNVTDASSTTEWRYALGMDEHGSASSGKVTLYELAAGNVDALLSDNLTTSGDWRDGQVVQVDTTGAIGTGREGTWSVDGASNILSFEVNLLNTNLWNDVNTSNELAIQWGMTCANDVVSGSIPVISLAPPSGVPEPGILALLCSGLGGLVWSRRRKLTK